MAVARAPVRSQAAVAWLLVAVIIGYPIAGLVASAMNWDSLLASLPLRVGVLLLSLWVWVRNRNPGSHRGQGWLAAFATLYLIRLVWDATVGNVSGATDAIVFYIATVLVPAMALWRGAHALDERQAERLMLGTGTFICASAVAMHLLGVGADRALTENTGRLSFEALNPISLGHAATTTLIALLCVLHQRVRRSMIPWLLAAGAVAAAALLLSASRGPLLCLLVAAIAFTAVTRRSKWILLIVLAMLPWLTDPDTELWQRFATLEEDESALERLEIQANSIVQFLANPFLGSAFVERESLTYPHNIFIETAMALGLVGVLLLMLLLWRTLRSLVMRLRMGRLLVPLLFVQYFVGAQLSGAIYGNSALWVTIGLLIGCQARRRRARPRSAARAVTKPQLLSPTPAK